MLVWEQSWRVSWLLLDLLLCVEVELLDADGREDNDTGASVVCCIEYYIYIIRHDFP